MIKFENTEVFGWEAAIRGMRNPMNSWDKIDSGFGCGNDIKYFCDKCSSSFHCTSRDRTYNIGPNDLNLMKSLIKAGTDHRKFMRMINVTVDITAPLYWWKEFDTYKVGTVANSCSTMYKISEKEFTIEDFSCEHLFNDINNPHSYASDVISMYDYKVVLNTTIFALNNARLWYLETKDKKYWWQMIQLLPSSYNQKRTVQLNYEVLANIYKARKNHKLDEWCEHPVVLWKELHINEVSLTKNGIEIGGTGKTEKSPYFGFCDWIKTLPYSELITMEFNNDSCCGICDTCADTDCQNTPDKEE